MVGDNQTVPEGPLAADQIKGVLTAFIRNGRLIRVEHPVYRALSGVWLALRPVRRLIAVPVAAVKKRLRAIVQKKSNNSQETTCFSKNIVLY